MKTALLYTGAARTVCQMYENHRWYLRALPNPDIFVSIVDDENAEDMRLLWKGFPKARFEMEKVVQPDIPEPAQQTVFRSGYPRSTSAQAVLKQLWALNRCWEFFTGFPDWQTYDLIVRVRPDTAFVRCELGRHREFLDLCRGRVVPKLCLVPWWDTWSGVNDRFAVLGRNAAAYFTTFRRKDELWEMGCPLHPEQMVAESLKLAGIRPDPTLACEFLTVRVPDEKSHRGSYIKIEPSVIDICEYARWKR